MKAFFVKYRRLISLMLPFLLYIFYLIVCAIVKKSDNFFSTEMFLDSYIPFIDFAVYGYISWVPLAAVSVIFLLFCPGDGYYRLIIAIAISVLICLIISLSYPVRMDIPHFGDSAFLVAVLKNSGIASFPNIPSCILSNGFFLMIFYKKIHKRSKCLPIVLLFGLILLAWIVCALLSKMTHISDLLIGILIGAVSSLSVWFIPFKQTH